MDREAVDKASGETMNVALTVDCVFYSARLTKRGCETNKRMGRIGCQHCGSRPQDVGIDVLLPPGDVVGLSGGKPLTHTKERAAKSKAEARRKVAISQAAAKKKRNRAGYLTWRSKVRGTWRKKHEGDTSLP
jgi:hypothetical protein